MDKKFQRKIEDFICENCKEEIKGDGYTNHCPFCLWSKHVDINPGDRASDCRGMMKAVKINKKSDEYIITHRCLKCGYEKNNKVSKKDNFDELLKL
ncbi:MAG: RNHCP domain-containing protein [Candidatus Pacebacteria bacterium]|nr:RNHCP domain-containing protein [Candidatus Paceibacterota bacterium]